MTYPTAEFFEGLDRRAHEPSLRAISGSVRFDVRDEGRTEPWLVRIDSGDISVSHDDAEADCVVRTERAVFDGVASGRVNAMAALLRGTIDVAGDIELLVLFQRLFPGPPATTREERS